MKKIVVTMLIVCMLVLAFSGCAQQPAATETTAATAAATEQTSDTSAAATDADQTTGGRTIGFCQLSGVNALCQEMEAAIREYVEAQGDKLVVLDSQFDTSLESQNMEDFITQKVDGIIIEVCGYETTTAQLVEAQNAGIPVVACDQMVQRDDLVLSQTVSNNYLAGQLAAEDMISRLGETFKCLVINIPGQTACDDRESGFRDTVADYPGIEIVATGNGQGLVDVAASITENLIQANPDVEGVFCINDPNAIGALSAYESAGKTDQVLIYGVDGSPEALQYVKEGKLAASVKQNHGLMGKTAAEDLYTYFNGGTIEEKHKQIDVIMVNKDNVDQYLTE